ncbi:MAG: DUF4124 domain-containing protein [Gammaproteobacteria bacterium]|nr:DUF4124 domain-containing protein [Gammaproteobacteria bacterium]
MKPLLVAAALLLALPAQAEVYRIVNPDGSVTFTDQPQQGAEKVKLPPVSTYPAPRVSAPVQASSDQDEESTDAGYNSFVVTEPAPETTIRDNQGNVSMQVRVEPALRVEQGHRIQFMVDGVDQGEPSTNTGATFQNVNRGSHSLSARLIDAEGNTLMTTPPVTVFVRQASVLFPARQ